MSVRFALYDNPFNKASDQQVARVVPQGCAGDEEVLEMIMVRHNGLSRSEVVAVLEEYAVAIEYLLQRGHSVHTSLMKIEASIQGKFEGREAFNPKKHQLCLNMTPGKRLRHALREVKAKRIHPSSPRPWITSFQPFDAQLPPDSFLPGSPVQLRGRRLKVRPANTDEGVFLIGEDRKTYRIDYLVTNEPRRLIFMIPNDLPAGSYQLEVRARCGNSTELRRDRYEDSLHCLSAAALR